MANEIDRTGSDESKESDDDGAGVHVDQLGMGAVVFLGGEESE